MTDILLLLIGATLVNNFVLMQHSAVASLKDTAGKLHTVITLAIATSLVLVLSSICTWFFDRYLLLPFGLAYLRTVTYVLIIVMIVNLGAIIIHKTVPGLSRLPVIFIPLITTNAAVLGVALINHNEGNTFAESVFYGLGTAAGFSLLLITFSVLSERLTFADVPKPFQGASIALITAGLISLALMGLV